VKRFSVFVSGPTSLLTSKTASLYLYSIYALAQYINMVSTDQELTFSIQSHSLWISCTFPVAYSKAKLKNNGDKSSPCFRPSWMGSASDIRYITRNLIQLSFKQILVSLTSFTGKQNSIVSFIWSWTVRTLRSWFRIPLKAQMFVRVLSVLWYPGLEIGPNKE